MLKAAPAVEEMQPREKVAKKEMRKLNEHNATFEKYGCLGSQYFSDERKFWSKSEFKREEVRERLRQACAKTCSSAERNFNELWDENL